MSFLNVEKLSRAKEILKESLNKNTKSIKLPLIETVGRILAQDIIAPNDLPQFDRATVDGFAVNWKDTAGAGEFSPCFSKKIGQIEMGKQSDLTVGSGTVVAIPTGGLLPEGADAVVMLEHTEMLSDTEVAIFHSVAPYSGVMKKGEDIKKNQVIVSRGTQITPAMVGTFSALGYSEINVCAVPKIAYFSTGDELVDPPTPLTPGQIWDITKYTVSALLKQQNFPPTYLGHIEDDPQALHEKLSCAADEYDIIILSGGSSVGAKDMVAQTIDQLGSPGILFHGLLMKPGKPAIAAKIGDAFLFGLPGHPGAAFIVMWELVLPFLLDYCGASVKPMPAVRASLSTNLPASDGRRSYYLVNLVKEEEWQAIPIFGKSGAIHGFAMADGFIVIPEGQEGYTQGQTVDVHLF